MDAVHLSQLGRGLDDEHHAYVVSGEVADGLGNDRYAAQGGELIEQHQHLVLERGISLRELARLKTDRLLEEEVEDGSQAVQIMGMDSDVDRQGLAAQLAKIKVALGRCVIQDGVQPQIQATREGLADRARRDRR